MEQKTRRQTSKIELTPEQQEQIKQATGKEVAEVQVQPEALEERIAPISLCSSRF